MLTTTPLASGGHTQAIINVKSYLYFIFNQINNHIKGKFNSSMLQKSSRCHPTRVLTRLFNCTKCKKGFTTAKAALKHEKDHHSEDGKPFKCKLCQVKFSHSWAVTNHLRKGRCKGSQIISWEMLNLRSANILRSHLLPKNKLHDLHVTNERFLIETFLLLPQVIILSTYYCTSCF